MDTLQVLGFDPGLRAELDRFADNRLRPARIASVATDRVLLLGLAEPVWVPLGGRFRQRATALEMPAVGDWAAYRDDTGGPVVERLFARRTALLRRAAGGTQPQVVCANVDTVLIVTAVGRDLNPRRLERYLAAVWESGAEPVIVINKADLGGEAEGRREVEAVALGVPVVATSAVEAEGLDELTGHLVPQRTYALAGSSGVGKSTLVNRLLGRELQATNGIRESDGRGRHTTTRRELIVAPSGAILIDTPGMREFGLWDAQEGLERVFPEIDELARQCRFRDCQHRGEAGCAIAAAVAAGRIAPERLASYQRLQRELAYQARATDQVLARQHEQQWKRIHQSIRVREKLNRKLGID